MAIAPIPNLYHERTLADFVFNSTFGYSAGLAFLCALGVDFSGHCSFEGFHLNLWEVFAMPFITMIAGLGGGQFMSLFMSLFIANNDEVAIWEFVRLFLF